MWGRTRSTALAIVAAALLAGAPARADDAGHAPGQIIVRLTFPEAIEDLNAQFGTEVIDEIGVDSTFLLQVPGPMSEEILLGLLESIPAVDWAGLNSAIATMDGTTGSFFVSGVVEDFEEQYALSRIGLVEVEAERLVRVAVLDTGADADHPILAGRIGSGGIDLVDNDGDTDDTANGEDDDGDGLVDELVGHGTYTSGIIARVAPDAEIVPVRVLGSDGNGYAFQAARGIQHIIDIGVDVAAIGFASPGDSQVLARATQRAIDAGIIIVAPAGNIGADEPLLYPAGYGGVVAVAATDESDVKAPFSSYGAHVTIAAPGRAIFGPLPAGAYGSADGTSAANALVAGASALLAGRGPLGAEEVIVGLEAGASLIDDQNAEHAGLLGAGRLDVAASLVALEDAPSPADLDGDGSIALGDLLVLLAAWGSNPGHPADLDGNGEVGLLDLLALLAAWT